MRGNHGLIALAAQDAGLGSPYSFAEFERRAAHGRAAARRREQLAGATAAVAVLLGLAGGLWTAASRPGAAVVETPPAAGLPSAAGAPSAATPPAREVTAEHWLAAVPAEPVVVRVGSYATVAALEDRLAFIDDRLNDSRLAGGGAVDAAALNRERTRLVNALASVRYAQALAGNFR